MIFVVTIALLGKVRVDSNDKPTDQVSQFVKADDPSDVPTLVKKWCKGKGLPFAYVQYQSRAEFQDLSKYLSPAEMIGVAV